MKSTLLALAGTLALSSAALAAGPGMQNESGAAAKASNSQMRSDGAGPGSSGTAPGQPMRGDTTGSTSGTAGAGGTGSGAGPASGGTRAR